MFRWLWDIQSHSPGLAGISDSRYIRDGYGVMSPRSWWVICLRQWARDTDRIPCGQIYLSTACIQMRSGWYCWIFVSSAIPLQYANGVISISQSRIHRLTPHSYPYISTSLPILCSASDRSCTYCSAHPTILV